MTLLLDSANRKLVSIATPWEVAIKMSLKKLDIGGSFPGFFQQHMLRNNFEWLGITVEHLEALVSLPFHHKDSFDRVIISQAIREQIPVVGCDVAFDDYPIRRLW